MIHLLVLLSVLCTTLHAAYEDFLCPDSTIISRQEWGAESYTCQNFLIHPVSNVVIHHIPGTSCLDAEECKSVLRNIQAYHMEDRQMKDIAYNFLIDQDGNVYEGRGWRTVGYHDKSLNMDSIGIAFIGTFSHEFGYHLVLDRARELIECGEQKGLIELEHTVKVYLHKGETVVPADPGLIDEIESWFRK